MNILFFICIMLIKKRTVLLLILILSFAKVHSQGYIMIAGGGSEVAGGWSDAPYRWVVSHSGNKRIAVITYDPAATQWIPDYFKSLGASAARNFIIPNRSSADNQIVYDSLITYGGVFIKGGDQAKYYEYYKGTKTLLALQYIFDHGGVISGTSAGSAIISPVVYTAQVTSVDPAAALMYAFSAQITLATDFLQTWSERYIYDTHFIERGRFGRLPSFMATWYKQKKELAVGIGVDDHTALCIDKNQDAFVYGTGAVSLIRNRNIALPYDVNMEMMRAGEMEITQLLHGCTVNLKTGSLSGLPRIGDPPVLSENGENTLLFSGTDYPVDDALNYFVNNTGNKNDVITIVTGSSVTRASDVKSKLIEKGAGEVMIAQAVTGKENDAVTRNAIERATKFLFIANDYDPFFIFMKSQGNGRLLDGKIRQKGMISFFAGDNARFAGKTVIHKYTGYGTSSYNGTMEFLPGLALLKSMAIMPNAFINSSTYENTVSGLPFAMVKDTLAGGIYITGNTLAAYSQTAGKYRITAVSGSFPLIFLRNKSHYTGFANQGPNALSRNIAGFDRMELKFLGNSDFTEVGDVVSANRITDKYPSILIYPSPAGKYLKIEGIPGHYNARIFDLSGRLVAERNCEGNSVVSMEGLKAGLFWVEVFSPGIGRISTRKFQVIH